MAKTITIQIVKEEVLTFKVWATNYAKTRAHDYNEEAEYKAALLREWNRLLNETGGSVRHEDSNGATEEEIEEALEDYDCSDEHEAACEETARLEALGLSKVRVEGGDYLWDETNNILLDLQQKRVGTFDGNTITLDQQ